MEDSTAFEEVARFVRQTALLETTQAVLEWDERTGLPQRAGAYRAEQITHLSGLIHRRRTDPWLGEALQGLVDSLGAGATAGPSDNHPEAVDPRAASIRRLHKEFLRQSKLPVDLVQAIAKATVLGQQAWERARAEDDWRAFEPHLKTIFGLRRQEAELLADGGPLYDALLDQYEEGARSDQLAAVFDDLRKRLVELVQTLSQAPRQPTGQALVRPVAVDRQRTVSRWIAEQIGFDFSRGRLDETTHPFCTTLGPHDCRILTRYQTDFFASGFYGTLHETGHGLYEQGLPEEWFGLPAGSYCSLGVHESQSRLWENFVGRSRPFWQFAFPRVATQVDGAWEGLDSETLYRDSNCVRPSLIRVEADEVTYNLHILIRFEIEQQLLHGNLDPCDAPQAWNDRYAAYLGVRPTSYSQGILQDVHWSAGLVGYFPTYTLGNLYAAQLMEAIAAELGDSEAAISQGDFQPLLAWLRNRIHAFGACWPPAELMQRATGQSLSAEPLDRYLRNKLYPIYGLNG
ncbi:MAG: carboxypeptidase M32 [Planctomycetota bacterium]|nr:MAG: carboxypeptidase M32 [Planctomycetota bacterium]